MRRCPSAWLRPGSRGAPWAVLAGAALWLGAAGRPLLAQHESSPAEARRVQVAFAAGRARPASDFREEVRTGQVMQLSVGLIPRHRSLGARVVGALGRYPGREPGAALQMSSEGVDVVAPLRRRWLGTRPELFAGAQAVHSSMRLDPPDGHGAERGPTRTAVALSGGVGGAWRRPFGGPVDVRTEARLTRAMSAMDLPLRYTSVLVGVSWP